MAVVLPEPPQPPGASCTPRPARPEPARGAAQPRGARRHHGKNLRFVFDHVFDEEGTQEEVFQHSTLPLLDTLPAGCNCSGNPGTHL